MLLCYCVVYSLYSCISIPFCLSRNFPLAFLSFLINLKSVSKSFKVQLFFGRFSVKVWYDSGRRPSEPMLRVHASMPRCARRLLLRHLPVERRDAVALPRRNFSSQMIPPPPGDPAKNPYTTSGEPKGTMGNHGWITS